MTKFEELKSMVKKWNEEKSVSEAYDICEFLVENLSSEDSQYNWGMVKKYLLYLLRWQLSTPILALCVCYFAGLGEIWATVIANLIGGLIFFWVDRFIFKDKTKNNML